MDQHDDFDSVSWRNDPDSDNSRPTTSGTDTEEQHGFDYDVNGKRMMSSAHEEPQAGGLADAIDLAGIGDGVLECQVSSPLKENDGTKDAYVSYLITTHVSVVLIHCGCFFARSPRWVGACLAKGIMDESTDRMTVYRPTSNPSRNRSSLCADDSQTSTSYTRRFIENTLPARSRRCLISTRWSTCGETGSDLNSPPAVLGPFIDSSSV